MVRYEIETKILPDENGREYVGYGIKVYDGNKLINAASDISLNYDEVKRLCDRLNECELDPIHLPDVVEDFLVLN